MRVPTLALTAALLLLFTAGPAAADKKFHAVPAASKAEQGRLQVKVVSYDGSTNGALTVVVRNPSETGMMFSAQGLYFVPDGDPDQAPQRLGAVGPFQIATDKDDGDVEAPRREKLFIKPGASATLVLDVFCIDSHRDSPSSETAFTIGKKRMPKQLATAIDRKAKIAADKAGGFAAPAAKSEVQSAVWETRDAKWIQLDGEGEQEATK